MDRWSLIVTVDEDKVRRQASHTFWTDLGPSEATSSEGGGGGVYVTQGIRTALNVDIY